MQHPRTLKALALALALGLPMQARAQAPFFVPIPASILVGPLVMLLIPLGMELSKSDEKRVQELEARGDWASVVAMATQHLGAKPGDLYWLELRGRALQRQMGCAAALPDLRQAFDGRLAQAPLQPEPTFAAGLSLGLCEMAVWDLNAAAATMVRLSPLAPQRWEPIYNLGVIRALQGDLDGARAAEAALRPRNAEMADALLARYIVPGSASPAPDTAAGLSAQALPERLPPALAEQALTIGNRMLVLPQGRWFGTAASSRTVLGGHIRVAPVKIDRVELTTLGAFEVTGAGRLAAAVAFTANKKQAFGISYWNVDDPCASRDGVYVERFNSPFDQPECLRLRVLTPAMMRAVADLQPVLQAAEAAGATLPAAAYEVQYARHGLDWVVTSTWLVPTHRLAGGPGGRAVGPRAGQCLAPAGPVAAAADRRCAAAGAHALSRAQAFTPERCSSGSCARHRLQRSRR
jgi:Flp pilus assembly protein TadD